MSTIEFDLVGKTYGDGDNVVEALQDINFEAETGNFISVVGPSGCGKTTLLHMTGGLLEPTTGSVRLNGTSISDEGFDKSEIGLVFQKPVLLDWRTVNDNVLLPIDILDGNNKIDGKDEYVRRKDELLDLVGLEDFGDSYPAELSGGMQQRVSICRSLVYDPSVLLMDEPFGALDDITRDQMNTELLNIWNETNKTILFVTHNLEEALYLSDKIIILSDRPGRIINIFEPDLERPRTEQIREQDKFYEEYSELNRQFRQER